MSSPIAKEDKSSFDSLLIKAHKALAHGPRTLHLINILSSMIRQNGVTAEGSLLDCGCGDMSIAKAVAQSTGLGSLHCLDVYQLPDEKKHDPQWAPYQSYNGIDIPYADKSFTYVMLIDVLHHVDEENMARVLSEALRVGRFVLLKDHLEYGLLSRGLLWAMDYVGNKGYGVNMPKRYLNGDRYAQLLKNVGATVVRTHDEPIRYYSNPLLAAVLSPKLHFLHCLTRS